MISSLTPDIIYEDKDIIVCHKPAGVPTQSSRIGTKDMVSILKNHLIKNTAKKTTSREPYLAVIHRLAQPHPPHHRQRYLPAVHCRSG